MRTLTAKDVTEQPEQLLDDARRGEPDLIVDAGEAVMLTLPLGTHGGDATERLDLAITLYERDVVSLGIATKIAGLTYSRMIDELGRRQIPVVRYDTEDFDKELTFVRGLAGR